MPRRSYLLVGVFLLTIHVAAEATTIVILQSDGQIIIAADSKRRYEQAGDTLFEATACKILVIRDVVFAASGSTALAGADGTGIFDVRALAGQALNQSGRLRERVELFDQALARELTRVRSVLDKRHTTSLFLEVVLAGVENGRPSSFIRRFEVTAGADGQLAATRIERRSCDECRNLIEVLGHDDGIFDLLEPKTAEEIQRMERTVETARNFIRVEIERTPDWVGPPIDVLHLDSSGVHWDERKPECHGG